VIDYDEVARLALALPEVTEGERFGHRTWFVNRVPGGARAAAQGHEG
jgi:hypothetical protein